MTDKHELGASAYAIYGGSGDEVQEGYPEKLSMSAKVDYKWGMHRNIALVAGTGAGFSRLGAHWAADLGFLAGPNWRRFLPYAATRLGLSVPIDKRAFMEEDGSLDYPSTTFMLLGAGGFLVPLNQSIALSFEVGIGGLFTEPHHGIAGYSALGLNLTL